MPLKTNQRFHIAIIDVEVRGIGNEYPQHDVLRGIPRRFFFLQNFLDPCPTFIFSNILQIKWPTSEERFKFKVKRGVDCFGQLNPPPPPLKLRGYASGSYSHSSEWRKNSVDLPASLTPQIRLHGADITWNYQTFCTYFRVIPPNRQRCVVYTGDSVTDRLLAPRQALGTVLLPSDHYTETSCQWGCYFSVFA